MMARVVANRQPYVTWYCPLKRPENWFAVIAKGDEVLSCREMSARYAHAKVKLIEGSDHALSDFDDHSPEILAFLNRAA